MKFASSLSTVTKKVLMKLTQETAPLKRAGRPPQRRKNRKPYSNGWLMITDQSTGINLS